MERIPEKGMPAFFDKHPLVRQMLKMHEEGAVVLDNQARILDVNDLFLHMLHIPTKDSVVGRLPGDAIGCVNAAAASHGCGTSEYCSTCGAAIAIHESLTTWVNKESRCVASIINHDKAYDLCLKVRAFPLEIDGQPLVFLFFRDITDEELRVAIEQTYFHDINNIITALKGMLGLADRKLGDEEKSALRPIQRLLNRLFHEITLQDFLSRANQSDYECDLHVVTLDSVLEEICVFFGSHPVAFDRSLVLPPHSEIAFRSDPTLLHRVLLNMLKNAFEATEEGGEVRLSFEQENGRISFKVWNSGCIPADIARRIFQRHFSTKNEPGRGFGTYAMRLVAERFLKGSVSFTSTPENGTTFVLSIPI